MTYQIHNGDCIEVMKSMPENSIDAIVTDPPYELGFMGKSWDSTGIAFNVEVWKEVLRILKPGGHLLAFSGSRTYHRMAVAIEDAGFEIRDQIMWVYGSGFPKSLDISKAIDKVNGETDRLIRFTLWMRTTGLKVKDVTKVLVDNGLIGENGTIAGHYFAMKTTSQPAIPTAAMWKVIRPLIAEVPEWVDELVQRIEAEREITGMHKQPAAAQVWMQNYGLTDKSEAKERKDIPATDEAKQWQGWGTALKPAHEPIVMARKPLIGTVAANVLEHGTGGLNIDGTRVGSEGGTFKASKPEGKSNGIYGEGINGTVEIGELNAGRFPANLIHDGSDEVLALFPDTKATGSGKVSGFRKGGASENSVGLAGKKNAADGFADSGSAARFFYCAKTSKRDRNEGLDGFEAKRDHDGRKADGIGENNPRNRTNNAKVNYHPTVKPTDLMQYLCRLVTPPNGIVLDPFMGSGSTGKGAIYEGFNFIGIEMEAEYVAIAKARIEFAVQDMAEKLL